MVLLSKAKKNIDIHLIRLIYFKIIMVKNYIIDKLMHSRYIATFFAFIEEEAPRIKYQFRGEIVTLHIYNGLKSVTI